MKRFLLRVLLFSLVFFALDKLFYIFLFIAPKLEEDHRLELLLNGKINKELIVMGSSRGAYNIIAEQIEKETGKTAYNISYAGSNVQFHLFLLKTLLKFNNKPKTIVLSLDNPYEFLYVKTFDYRYDKMYPLEKYNYINDELIRLDDKSKFSKIFCLARLNRNSFNFRKKGVTKESPILECGSMPFSIESGKNNFKFDDKKVRYPVKEELKDKKKAFLEFQKICKENNIKLIYCLAPNFRVYNSTLEHRIKDISLPENRFFVYDTTDFRYKKIEYFHDESHLNIRGAKLFTSELSKFINLNK
ncbi:hypothetical protein [Flavobacterium nitrogenifigens]|uniref:DUF1574 domain-containing protein n=1 Tax=Flavobacterium nitrogenifigens TaxID=1617283 RepID=A0A521EDY3_9FLAO|nr:hypothetical protein [Flavobacterium nitrogenifigens]KAF2325949.1 hypothetical protein DM397_22090 [Flavobacterium nitrogenifigens]SMO82133.1 hypothetical protein SAMN06265220_104155 [Flavobacterium nitrogenifigens]